MYLQLPECMEEEAVGNSLAVWRGLAGVENQETKTAFFSPVDLNEHLTFAVWGQPHC